MLRVAICDDERNMLNFLCKRLEAEFKKHRQEVRVVPFLSVNAMLSQNMENKFDVIFLDIMMPEKSGFEAAREIRKFSDKSFIIFITSNDELVYDSFEFQPFNFIKKDSRDEIGKSISVVIQKLLLNINQNHIIELALAYGETKELSVSDIVYVMSDNHYLNYVLLNNDEYRIRRNICDAEEELSQYNFVRMHRRYIANLKNVSRIDKVNETVYFINRQCLQYGKTYESELMKRYMLYMRSII